VTFELASDNTSGVLPEVWEALRRADDGRAAAYGDDPITARCQARFREVFGERSRAFPVWGGTAANVLGLGAVCAPYHAVLCGERSHLVVDECGAPTRALGGPLLPLPTEHGKVTPAAVAARIEGIGVVHSPQPRVLSITQPTEVGTVYTPEEIGELAELVHGHGMLLHVDGARLPLAAAALGTGLADVSLGAGADLLAFGGTKCGLLGAEAVVFAREALVGGFAFHQKQLMQLPSKLRYLSAQLDALLEGELWRRTAARALRAAARLEDGLAGRVALAHPRQTNALFVRLPSEAHRQLSAVAHYYPWGPAEGGVFRWMVSFDTPDPEIDGFVEAAVAALPGAPEGGGAP
jgi:threonine aldolase